VNTYLLAAGLLAIVLGALHAVLGETTLVRPILRLEGLPPLFRSRDFMRRTFRMAWHVTTILLWGVGILLILLARDAPEGLAPDDTGRVALEVLAGTFLACALLSGVTTRGRHFGWLFFFAIAALTWLGR
jgi:hypothetical protein